MFTKIFHMVSLFLQNNCAKRVNCFGINSQKTELVSEQALWVNAALVSKAKNHKFKEKFKLSDVFQNLA